MSREINSGSDKIVDPVLPDQAGRMTQADPGSVLPGTEEDIRRRAYAIYESRGKKDGNPLDDWLAAESSVQPTT
ncbi:MAG TPA: DUF2934 domain-containing protein [Terriglobales bacterium]